MIDPKEKIFCALDTVDLARARSLAEALRANVGGIKLGLEFFMAHGAKGFETIAATGVPIFLDLKFHDIPNTVAGAIRAVAPLGPKILTIHTQGGPDMMRRAQDTAAEMAQKHRLPKPDIIGVTVLTSLNQNDIAETGLQGNVADAVERLASLANTCGLDGIVCSPQEIDMARRATRETFKLVVPGIRPPGSEKGDQKRVMTPKEAVDAGADILVIGRPITQAPDPAAAAAAIVRTMA